MQTINCPKELLITSLQVSIAIYVFNVNRFAEITSTYVFISYKFVFIVF
jgi:hypothetical protein